MVGNAADRGCLPGLIPEPAAEITSRNHKQTQTMTRARTLLGLTLLATCLAAPGGAAIAQQGGLIGNLFNGGDRQAQAPQPPAAVGGQGGAGVDSRIDSIESALRQLTGQVEVLQHQTQMLQMQLNRMMQNGGGKPAQPMNGGGAGQAPYRPPGQRSETLPAQNPQAPQNQRVANAAPQGDAFNPAQHPNAPGVPHSLGSAQPMVGGAGNQMGNGMNGGMMGNNAPVGAPGGREPGAPLDLNALAGTQNAAQPAAPAANGVVPPGTMQSGAMPAGGLPPPPPRNPSATGTKLATLPPNSSPKDVYELGYGYVLHKNYGLAAQTFRYFLRKYPKDHRVADAHYWLGESLFQEQHYDDAARSFLTISTNYKHFSRAPDALLRLGQSLAALHHKEAACATLSEVKKKYPHASSSVKRAVARELKRVHC